MALDKARMTAAMEAKIEAAVLLAIEAQYPVNDIENEAMRQYAIGERAKLAAIYKSISGAISEAVVDEFVAFAEVVVSSVGGVTAGVDSSGPGSGTIS